MNNSARYWKNVALIREIQAQDHATYTVNELEIMYRDSVRDLDAEVRKIFNTFSVGAGITEAEARALINNAKNDEIAARLKELLAKTNDPAIRAELTKKIHAQAYGARMSRLEAVKQNVYAYFAGKALTEIQKTRTLYNTVIEESYYSTIHDIAKGCNVGINFSLIPQKTLDEMLSEKWHGAQFSERVWNNTAEAATRAQEIISRGLLAHTPRSKMADELAAVTNNTKYNAMRLVRTQTNHYTNLSELKAYKELGIEQYKYLATLDERTCETCSPLDGKIFYIKDAVEGVNYPSMHPHCRCTTTFPRNYAARWARDPHSGKGYKIPDMTYSEWIDSLSDEQKAAFEKSKVVSSVKSVDKSENGGIIKTGNIVKRKKLKDTFEPMPKEQFDIIKKAFEKNGKNIFRANDESEHYVRKRGAEAITLNENTVLFTKNPSRAAVFEELIHTSQWRNGKIDGTGISILKCEVEAKEKLLRNAKAYNLTDSEIEATKILLENDRRDLKKYL